MANRDAPMGLRPAMHLTGGTIRVQEYHIADQLANNIFYGDPVERVEAFSGREARDIDASDTPASEVPFVGVFAGCTYQATNGDMVYSRYWPSGTATKGAVGATAYVWDDPFIVFSVQGDGTGLATDVGLIADLLYTEGDTATGMSKVELHTSDIGAGGSGANVYIYDYVRSPENSATGANTQYLVLINEHAYRTAGAASYDELATS